MPYYIMSKEFLAEFSKQYTDILTGHLNFLLDKIILI